GAYESLAAREGSCLNSRWAGAYAKGSDLVGRAGSEAHRAAEMGLAFVEMTDFAGRADFLGSLRQGVAQGRLSGGGVHVFARYDRLRKWLGRKSSSPTR